MVKITLLFSRDEKNVEIINTNYASNQYFLEALISKLPVETFRALAIRYQCTKFTYKHVSDGLTEMIDLMERCKLQPQSNRKNEVVSKVAVQSKSQSRNASKSTQKKSSGNRSQNKAQLMKKVTASAQSSNLCVFCSKDYSSKHCSNYSTFESRRNRVRELNLCFICLKPGHRASDCSRTLECRNCSSDTHHTFLCIKLCQKPQNPNRTVNTSTPSLQSDNPPGPLENVAQYSIPSGNVRPYATSRRFSSMYTAAENSDSQLHASNAVVQRLDADHSKSLPVTALPVATVQISGSGARRATRVFFDTGSQRTFIQKDLVQLLKLPIIDRVQLSVAAFDSEIKLLTCDVVRLQVCLGRTQVTLRAIAHDNVNTHIYTPGLVQVADFL